MKIYITFGQAHAHRVNGVTYDKDSVCEIECQSYMDGRKIAFEFFGDAWAFAYTTKEDVHLEYFPRGVIPVNG